MYQALDSMEYTNKGGSSCGEQESNGSVEDCCRYGAIGHPLSQTVYSKSSDGITSRRTVKWTIGGHKVVHEERSAYESPKGTG
jgi:hypothetical protein